MPQPARLVIGLRGQAGAGKTTLQRLAADMAATQHLAGDWSSPAIYPYSMAGPIRAALKTLGVDKAIHPTLYRRMAQWIGTEGCRAEDPNWWVNLAKENISRVPPEMVIVIDDIRFPNEATLCDKLVFISPNFPVLDLGERATHESETWNSSREGRIDKVITNEHLDPARAARELLSYITSLR